LHQNAIYQAWARLVNDDKQPKAVQDLSLNGMKLILKTSFTYCLMNEFDIFFELALTALNKL
jgi:hypothetical protein